MIDLRSDTVTKPTQAMREAMYKAEVGDDVYGDDPTVNELESLAAEIMEKEAAIFVPSGTMGNQVAIMSHTNIGDEIIVNKNAHIFQYEVGAYARLAGVSINTIKTEKVCFDVEDISLSIRERDNDHFPKTSLICFENPTTDGRVVPIKNLKNNYEFAKSQNLKVHMDGARIFNAAAALNVDVSEIARCTDSVMFCLSKGLCAPVGSMLCGEKEFIKRARRMRKTVGGGMRQAGVIAACGIVALKEMVDNIAIDNKNAKYLGKKLSSIDDFEVDLEKIDTNMVFVRINNKKFDHENFCDWMLQHDIKVYGRLYPNSNLYRFVTHHGVSDKEIDYFIEKLNEYLIKNKF